VHAEDCALSKLPPLQRHKRLKKVDLLVIRTSRSGLFGNSKPCLHCLQQLWRELPQRGYTLGKVQYSVSDEEFEECTLSELLFKDSIHVSGFYRELAIARTKCERH